MPVIYPVPKSRPGAPEGRRLDGDQGVAECRIWYPKITKGVASASTLSLYTPDVVTGMEVERILLMNFVAPSCIGGSIDGPIVSVMSARGTPSGSITPIATCDSLPL